MEDRISLSDKKSSEAEDWDNSRLIMEWKICKRTTANYRRQGLGFYKRGGRIMYSPEHRAQFIQLQKMKINENNKK